MGGSTGGLDDENIAAAHIIPYLDIDFPVREL